MRIRFRFLSYTALCLIGALVFGSCESRSSDVGWVAGTFAGSNIPGFVDGPVSSARFSMPSGIAVDASGNVYVADWFNHRIRIISGGEVRSFAGSGGRGFSDGPASSARFNSPRGVAVDSSGNVYVADTGNHLIRIIRPGGEVETLAGSVQGFSDGPAAQAMFDKPYGLAADRSGNLYVADMGNDRIRMISGGEVSTFAGSGVQGFSDGPASSARFKSPIDLALDSSGNLYAADMGNHRIRMISGGEVSTFAGSGSRGFLNGQAAAARFNDPYGLIADPSGNIYVVERDSHRIRVISSGLVNTFAGSGSSGLRNGPVARARFNDPYSLAVGPSGNIYVADCNNHRIRILSLE